MAWDPAGQRVATASDDGTARIWDATTGEQVGWWLEQLPEGELVTRDAASGAVIGASPRAWRWLGCHGPDPTTGELTRLPAETHGLLPSLSRG